MQDLQLERRLAEVMEIKAMWQLFFEYFKLGVKGGTQSQENEAKFLGVKSKIAMLHDALMSALSHDRQVGQNMMQIVARTITLKHITRMTDVDIKKIQSEWHEAFILLDITISELQDKKERLDQINPATFYLGRLWTRTTSAINNFLKSGGFIAFAVLAVLIGGGWAFMNFGGPQFLYGNELLRPLYYLGEDAYRQFMNPDQPFDKIERMWKKTRRLPNNFEEVSIDEIITRDRLESEMYNPGRTPQDPMNLTELLKKATEFSSRALRYSTTTGPGAGTIQVYTFLFERTYEAKDVLERVREWRRSVDQAAIQNFENRYRILRFINCIIIFRDGTQIMRDRLLDETFADAEKPAG